MVRSVTPMISAASHQVIFLAIAFNNTSCSFIIRSVSAAEYCPVVFNHQLPPPLFQSGHFMCEFHRTDHILATPLRSPAGGGGCAEVQPYGAGRISEPVSHAQDSRDAVA